MPDRDISSTLARINEAIDELESGSCSERLLHAVERDFLYLIELVKLFLVSERSTYHGYMLMTMGVAVDFSSQTIAGVRIDSYPPIFVSNPLLLCKLSLREIIYVVCHEIDHIVFEHPARMLECSKELGEDFLEPFNIAADAAVNDRLNHEIREGALYLKDPNGVVTSQWIRETFSMPGILERESYLYYFNIVKEGMRSREGFRFHGPKGAMLDDVASEGLDGLGDAARGGIVTAKSCGDPTDHDWGEGMDLEEVRSITREIVNAAYESMNDESRGLMPACFTTQVRKMNEPPKIRWQSLLKKYVGTICAGKRKTRTRLNRRQPDRFDLPGSVDSKTLKIVVAIDTSASVSDEDIAGIMGEVFDIVAQRRHEITIVECDSEVQRVYRAKGPEDVLPKVQGRGGTAFSPVVEFLNDDRYFRDALLVYFTDGFGEEAIPRPKTYRNLWVVLGREENLSLEEPFGAVIAL